MKQTMVAAAVVVLAAATILGVAAQQPAETQQTPPPNQQYALEPPEQLQRLVAPIALYPDSLVAPILAASSYPAEITEANNWLAPRRSFSPEQIADEADKQSWDPSVKSLLPFPPVLQNMASNLSWTSELGDTYYNRSADVLNAIQAMRRQAMKAGTLKSNDQIHVTDKDGYITIDPARPKSGVVYAPEYDPWLAYGYPIDLWPGWVTVPEVWWGGPGWYFGLGFGVGPFLGFGWGWGVDWFNRGLIFRGVPYYEGGPAPFNRYYYDHGYPSFARPFSRDPRFNRGFNAPRLAPGMRSDPL